MKTEDLDKLIPALIAVESAGKTDAIGDGGRAVGCLQIWPIMVEDVNRIAGTNYTLADRLDRKKSIEMAKIYLTHYAAAGTIEHAARKWNGGPAGHTKPATIAYWKKVKTQLEKI
jgi:hypothetical protein